MLRVIYPYWSKATETKRTSRNAFHVQLSAKNSSRKMKDRGTECEGERERGARVYSLLCYINTHSLIVTYHMIEYITGSSY